MHATVVLFHSAPHTVYDWLNDTIHATIVLFHSVPHTVYDWLNDTIHAALYSFTQTSQPKSYYQQVRSFYEFWEKVPLSQYYVETRTVTHRWRTVSYPVEVHSSLEAADMLFWTRALEHAGKTDSIEPFFRRG